MATLLILGNGFDLHCGLHTHFYDFLDSELEKPEIQNFYAHLCTDLMMFSRHPDVSSHPGCSLQDAAMPISIWEVIFLALKAQWDPRENSRFSYRYLNWRDVESVVQTSLTEGSGALISLPHIFELLYQHSHGGSLFNGGHSVDGAVEWLLAWFISYAPRFSQTGFHTEKTVAAQEPLFYSYLFTELVLFEKSFGDFVQEQVNNCPTYETTARAFAEKLCGSDHNVIVESFNYTSPKLKSSGFRNIHGTVKNPVIGIDANGIDPKGPLYQFTKASRCLTLAIQDEEVARSDFNVITNIVIYGHSLNAQDYTYFFNILETKRIQDPSAICEITFPYSVFKGTNKEQEQKKLHDSVASLLNSYDQWTNHHLSTVESLYFQRKYHFKEID